MTDYASGCARALQLALHTQQQASAHAPLLFAVDGRCGSGKSTLAAFLARRLHCPVFHLDDFFLPPELRTPARLAMPGENVHHERFVHEVIEPFLRGQDVCLRPFSCQTGGFAESVRVPAAPFAIVEGSYALHPALRGFYAACVFVTCRPEIQRARLMQRVGTERFAVFEARWIPLEERYISACRPELFAGYVLDTGDFSAPQSLCCAP